MDANNLVVEEPEQQTLNILFRQATSSDARFIARVTVESFQSKFAKAIGNDYIEKYIELETKRYAEEVRDFSNYLIADCDGNAAGLCVLTFHGTPSEPSLSLRDLCCSLGTCACCMLCWLECFLHTDAPRGNAYVDHICVNADFRGKGIGEKLLAEADRVAIERGCHTIFLYVAEGNRAKNLYQRFGYQTTRTEEAGCLTSVPTGVSTWYKMEKLLRQPDRLQ